MSSRRSLRPGSRNVHRLSRANRSSRKRPSPTACEVAVGAGDELEVARHLAVGADRQEALLLDGPQQHRLLVDAQLADLVEEEHAAVGRRAGPADRLTAPVNAPLTWPNSADMAASPRSVAQLTSTNGPAICCRAFFSS